MITEHDVVSILRRRGPLAARAIAVSLRERHGVVARKDVNQILYRGEGRAFARSEDDRPVWSLLAGVGSDDPDQAPPEGDPEHAPLIVTSREGAAREVPWGRTPAAIRRDDDG